MNSNTNNSNDNNSDDDDDDAAVIKDRVRLQLPHRPVGPAEFFCLRVWHRNKFRSIFFVFFISYQLTIKNRRNLNLNLRSSGAEISTIASPSFFAEHSFSSNLLTLSMVNEEVAFNRGWSSASGSFWQILSLSHIYCISSCAPWDDNFDRIKDIGSSKMMMNPEGL